MNLLKRYGLVTLSVLLSSAYVSAQTGGAAGAAGAGGAAGGITVGAITVPVDIATGGPVASAVPAAFTSTQAPTATGSDRGTHGPGITSSGGSIKVGEVKGGVTIVNADGTSSPATADSLLTAPLTIITDGDSSILLYLSNGAVIEIKPGSRIEISHFSQEPFQIFGDPFQPAATEPSSSQVSINVISGEVVAKVPSLGSGSTFQINTPTSNVVANDIVVVVDYNAQTAETQVSNVGGNGSLVYESNTAGSQPVNVPAGQAVTAPGQIDPATGAATTTGQPTIAPASSAAIEAGQQVSNPPSGQNPAQPTTAPAGQDTTPQLDIPDLINPTTTEPN